jgi:hypothetical protein
MNRLFIWICYLSAVGSAVYGFTIASKVGEGGGFYLVFGLVAALFWCGVASLASDIIETRAAVERIEKFLKPKDLFSEPSISPTFEEQVKAAKAEAKLAKR